jgi:hypothetical protein
MNTYPSRPSGGGVWSYLGGLLLLTRILVNPPFGTFIPGDILAHQRVASIVFLAYFNSLRFLRRNTGIPVNNELDKLKDIRNE